MAVATGVVAVGALGTGGASAAAGGAAGWCRPGATVDITRLPSSYDAMTCARDDLTLANGAARVRVPARGETVAASVLTVAGEDQLVASRAPNGMVTVSRAASATRAATASGCTSNAFVKLGYRWTTAYGWAYNPRNAPASVAGAAAAALQRATTNMTAGRDDCGIASTPRVAQRYLGSTSLGTGITAAGSCQTNDGKSVTAWMSVNLAGVLAGTCTWSKGGVAQSSDVVINTRYQWTVRSAGCRGAYDLTGVMTHERGHTFGLGHPAATAANEGLTMYPAVASCDFSKRTLGKGDLSGLLAIYG